MAKKNMQEEMTLEEARAYRALLYKPEKRTLSEEEKREQFRIFWAKEKKNYSKTKDLEQILWTHIKSINLDDPEKFADGVKHFGLKKVR